jgi:hypothetical protein
MLASEDTRCIGIEGDFVEDKVNMYCSDRHEDDGDDDD